jgi:hypothetical protein
MRMIREGIGHLEDLPIDEFVDTIRNMATMVAQEKLDGAQIWIGMDDDSKLFTSREGKRSNAERRYAPEEWPRVSAFNQFRAAHAALQTKEQELRRVLRPGDTVEAEVLFGRQPNSVTYGAGGKSYIAFLRGVNETPDEIAEHLSSSLANQQADAKFELVDTSDGKELTTRNASVPFQFIAPQRLDAAKLRQESGVEPVLKKLENVLKQSSGVGSLTNMQLATTAITTVPKEQKAAFKQAKTELLARLQTEFKLPIKSALLSKVSTKSGLAADDITPDEDVGIEGIVLRDPSTGKQVKIVDKDIFTAINSFNQSMRGEVQSALNTTDPDAPLQSRGGMLGQLRIRIAEVLGNRELAKASNVRKQLEPIKGKSPEEAIKNLASSMNIQDFEGVKKKILAMAAETYKGLDEKLDWFKTNKDNYQLKLKSGKTIGLSDEIVKKTLLTFAEARRNLGELFDKLKVTKTLAALLAVLYGSAARAVHESEPITEMMLTERQKHGEISVTDFDRKDTFQLVNSYLATVFMTMIIYHTKDTIGMRFLRDRKNWQLRKHNDDMSPLNHWGYAIWKAAKPDLDKHIMKAARAELVRVTKKIPAPWYKYLHMDFSSNNEVTVDWKDHQRTLTRLIELSGVRSERVNTLLDLSIRFPELELAEQKKAIKKIAAYAHQFVPRSRFYPRLKVILGDLKDEKDMVAEGGLLKRIAALTEEGEADGSMVGHPVNGATGAGAIAALPTRPGQDKRKTEMRRRNGTQRFLALTRKFKDPRNYKDIK